MPKTGNNNRKKIARRKKRRTLHLILTLMILIGAFFGWMAWNARTCHICMADVCLADLPPQMDGTKLLFISDFDIQNRNDAKAAAGLMKNLKSLNADLLVLGGDYSALSTFDLLNRTENCTADSALAFISTLKDFSAPLGKYAVTGEKDTDRAALAQALMNAGVQCLWDTSVKIEKNDSAIWITGLSDYSQKQTPFTKIAGPYSKGDCVIAVSHNPDAYAEIRTSEVSGGGAWADLVLSGHTLGGQIWLGDRNIRGERRNQKAYSGWQHVNDIPLLISQGLGCEGTHLRLGSHSEVWLITLKTAGGNV